MRPTTEPGQTVFASSVDRSSDPEIGKWRVNIKTETGQTIGSLHFNVIGSGVEPVLTGEVKK